MFRPPCDAELIAEWLHSGSGQPRSMEIWWECSGEDELDAVKLANILKKVCFTARRGTKRYEETAKRVICATAQSLNEDGQSLAVPSAIHF